MIQYNQEMVEELDLINVEYTEAMEGAYQCDCCNTGKVCYRIVGTTSRWAGSSEIKAAERHICSKCYRELLHGKADEGSDGLIKDTNKKTSRGDSLQLVVFAPGAACSNNVAVFRAAKAVWDNRGHFKTRDDFIAEQAKRKAERDRNNASARHYRNRH